MLRAALAATVALSSTALAAGPAPAPRPRLAVLVVVDQLGAGTLEHQRAALPGAFRRAALQGFWVREARFESAPTVTSPGHATLVTGTVPSVHGVVGNSWFDQATGAEVQSTSDARYHNVLRAPQPKDGSAPTALRAPTLGDALKAYDARAKVLAVAGKERGAILAGGRAADLALWFDFDEPRFTTSTYYAAELPAWVAQVNASVAAAVLKGAFQVPLPGGGTTGQGAHTRPTAPSPSHLRFGERPETLPLLTQGLVDLALAGVDALKLGEDEVPDLLTLSFSGTDHVGHDFGPDSREYAQALRLVDLELGRLLDALDTKVGKGRWVLALTSDHGHNQPPELLLGRRLDAGRVDEKAVLAALEKTADDALGKADWFQGYSKPGFTAKAGQREKLERIDGKLRAAAKGFEGVVDLLPPRELASPDGRSEQQAIFSRGWFDGRSPDYLLVVRPHWMYGVRDVAGHATGWLYDRAVPLFLLGAGVRAGVAERCEAVDVAPTLARLLGVPPPAAAQGRVLVEALAP